MTSDKTRWRNERFYRMAYVGVLTRFAFLVALASFVTLMVSWA